jgi:predicted transcriptional regulator
MLARYVEATYEMTAERYKEYCGLPDDYPMMAQGYDEERRNLSVGEPRRRPHLTLVGDDDRESPSASASTATSTPAITRERKGSVTRELIYCLFDGKGFAFPAKHVKEVYGMEWENYLAHCGLPSDYPSVAPLYSGDDRFLDF